MKSPAKNPAAVALGKLGRAANSPAQRAASSVNGKKGGRPKGAKDSKPRPPRSGVNATRKPGRAAQAAPAER